MKDNIKRLRVQKGLTQAQLSEVLGYNTPSIVAMWEAGVRKVPSDKLPLLAEILGCTIDDLYKSPSDSCAETA